MRKVPAFLAFLLAFSSINGISYASDTIPLSCAKKTNYSIRISNVIKGCEKTEVSLGAGAIPRSLIRPSAIDQQLMHRFKAAQAAAKKDGQALYIASGYRSLSRQKTLFAQASENMEVRQRQASGLHRHSFHIIHGVLQSMLTIQMNQLVLDG